MKVTSAINGSGSGDVHSLILGDRLLGIEGGSNGKFTESPDWDIISNGFTDV